MILGIGGLTGLRAGSFVAVADTRGIGATQTGRLIGRPAVTIHNAGHS
jgi:hypothetical protein